MLNRRNFIRGLLLGVGSLYLGDWTKLVRAAEKRPYKRLVILGDPHLPVRVKEHPQLKKQQAILAAKNAVIADINSWSDVDAVAAVGDMVERYAIESEYAYIRQFFGKLTKKLWVINGNHEFLYEDEADENGKSKIATAPVWKRKLEYFRTFWRLPQRWYTKEVANYHLIFLSAEDGPLQVALGETQLAWLEQDLAKHKARPTLIFFHGPLKNTLLTYKPKINQPRTIAMPADKLQKILAANPQVKLWISGHTHTPYTNPSYANQSVNWYNENLYNLHNDCMDRKVITTNSVYLYEDHIEIKTYNHSTQSWIPQCDRMLRID